MSDKELADVLVKAGIIRYYGNEYGFEGEGVSRRRPASVLVRDWRVAGACLERMDWDELVCIIGIKLTPRAVIAAFVEARS